MLFTHAAGVSPAHLSLLIRTTLLSSFLIWAAWCVLALFTYYKSHPSENVSGLLNKYVELFFLISILSAMVFI